MMEAFLVVAYFNVYGVIKRELEKELEKRSNSEVGNRSPVGNVGSVDTSPVFLYTANSRGATRNGGWSQAGVTMYNKLIGVITKQRENTKFEDDLVQLVLQSEKKRKRPSEGYQDPKNNLDELVMV